MSPSHPYPPNSLMIFFLNTAVCFYQDDLTSSKCCWTWQLPYTCALFAYTQPGETSFRDMTGPQKLSKKSQNDTVQTVVFIKLWWTHQDFHHLSALTENAISDTSSTDKELFFPKTCSNLKSLFTFKHALANPGREFIWLANPGVTSIWPKSAKH